MGAGLPSAVLFACTENCVRSVMAAALFRQMHGTRIWVDSVGVRASDLDPFVVVVMDEVGIDVGRHRPKTFGDLEDDFFDVVVTLSPEAHHSALELTRTMACDVEFWPTPDATAVEGSRDMQLDAYRAVRDRLTKRLRERFPGVGAPNV
jgi:protein-tyrosine-phosphatase